MFYDFSTSDVRKSRMGTKRKEIIWAMKKLGWLFDIGDYTTQLYGDYNKTIIRTPMKQPVFHGKYPGPRVFFRGSSLLVDFES